MALFFNKIERGNPSNPQAAKQWYPVLKSTGLVKEKEVAKLLADETTLNPKEAEMAVAQLMKVVTALLLNGNTVQLGELGSFRVTANCKGVATEAEVTAQLINKVKVRFSESESLKDAMKKATFKDVASLAGK
ncbi:DNA-binding protein [Bacteroidia bacterium]|nr:DNA-binding protein [Bacteroidia bacterium]